MTNMKPPHNDYWPRLQEREATRKDAKRILKVYIILNVFLLITAALAVALDHKLSQQVFNLYAENS